MTALVLSVITLVFPVKPDLTLKLTDISITKTIELAKALGYDIRPPRIANSAPPFAGRIGRATLELRGNIIKVDVRAINMPNDTITSATIWYNSRKEFYSAKIFALGGLIEVDGSIPK